MLNATILGVVSLVIGFLAKLIWQEVQTHREIKRLTAEKDADIAIHAREDKADAESVNPPSAADSAKWL